MNNDKEKEAIFYSQIVQGWINTRMQKDKSILTLSAGAIGLLITIFINVRITSKIIFFLFIVTILLFIIALICSIVIFEKNALYLSQQINNESSDSKKTLNILDKILFNSFIIGIILSFIIGVIISFDLNFNDLKKENNNPIIKDNNILIIHNLKGFNNEECK